MTDLLPTTYTSSSGKQTAIAELEAGHLHNAAAKALRERGEDDPMYRALQGEIAYRDAAYGDGAVARPSNSPLADQRIGANKPPPDGLAERKEFELRIEGDHAPLLREAADLESRAALLPQEVTSDEDVAKIDAWVRDSAALARKAERQREEAKAPFLLRGQVIDSFFKSVKDGLSSRVDALQRRKKPFMLAKARREEEERLARIAAERAAAERLRQQQAAAEQAARDAQRRADEEAQRLAQTEADRAAAEANARTQADADETEPDLTMADELAPDVDAAEAAHRDALDDAYRHGDRAGALSHAAALAERSAEALEESLAEPHKLGRAGESSLKSVWKARITGPREFMASLGPLEPYLKQDHIDAALERAAKAEPRPAIPGVTYEEDFEVATNTRARPAGNAGDAGRSF